MKFSWILKLLLLLTSAANLSATVIYSNLNYPLDGYNGRRISNLSDAVEYFYVDGTYSLTSVTVGVSPVMAGDPVGSPYFDVFLGNMEIAQNLDAGPFIAAPYTLVTAILSAPVTLTTGEYGIGLAPAYANTYVFWPATTAPSVIGPSYLLEVDGTIVTPEPTTMGLLTICLFPLLLFRKSWVGGTAD